MPIGHKFVVTSDWNVLRNCIESERKKKKMKAVIGNAFSTYEGETKMFPVVDWDHIKGAPNGTRGDPNDPKNVDVIGESMSRGVG